MLVGLNHEPNKELRPDSTKLTPREKRILRESTNRLYDFFEMLGEKPRRLFIELGSPEIEYVKKKQSIEGNMASFTDPFLQAVSFALDSGWEVVPMDRAGTRRVDTKLVQAILKKRKIPTKERTGGEFLRAAKQEEKLRQLERYNMDTVREKSWAITCRLRRISSNDIIIMHSGHVQGFRKECEKRKLDIGKTVNINRFSKKLYETIRLKEHEIEAIRENRKKAAQRRRLARNRKMK